MPISASHATHPGPRESLEDTARAMELSFLAPWLLRALLLLVCDGVGGHNGGEVASSQATRVICSRVADALAEWSGHRNRPAPDDFLVLLCGALQHANQTVLQGQQSRAELRRMATTVVASLVVHDRAYLASAGDSRAYRFRDGEIEQITHDHSEAQKLLDAGLIGEDEARHHPLAHTINRYIGMPTKFSCDTWVCHLDPGDLLLLCSDGLTDVLTDDQIAACIATLDELAGGLQDLPHFLTQEALRAGTTDNVTALCYEHQPSNLWARTCTGAYPVAAARAIAAIVKE